MCDVTNWANPSTDNTFYLQSSVWLVLLRCLKARQCRNMTPEIGGISYIHLLACTVLDVRAFLRSDTCHEDILGLMLWKLSFRMCLLSVCVVHLPYFFHIIINIMCINLSTLIIPHSTKSAITHSLYDTSITSSPYIKAVSCELCLA